MCLFSFPKGCTNIALHYIYFGHESLVSLQFPQIAMLGNKQNTYIDNTVQGVK